jgi:hypothetical protein
MISPSNFVTPALALIFELLGHEMLKHFVANHASVASPKSEAIPKSVWGLLRRNERSSQ